MFNPLFSILIAQHNNGKFFKDCYNSIINQTYKNWEVIIVDDCSTDETWELMIETIGDDARFKLFKNESNKGCGFTKNKCVDLANGSICGFLDPDDALAEGALEKTLYAHVKNPKASIIYTNHYICNDILEVQHICKWVDVQPENISCADKSNVGHFVTFKKDLYQKTKGINPYLKRAVDIDLYCKLEDQGQFVFINEPLYFYRMHSNGISVFGNRKKALLWVKIVKILNSMEKNPNFENDFLNEEEEKLDQMQQDMKYISTKKILGELFKRLKSKIY